MHICAEKSLSGNEKLLKDCLIFPFLIYLLPSQKKIAPATIQKEFLYVNLKIWEYEKWRIVLHIRNAS